MKIVYNASRWILAGLFVFSGFTKAVNPFGFSVQLGEYLQAMGLDFLKPLSGLGGIVIPSLELMLGVMLAMNLGRRLAAWGVMLFMAFFTGLTLWIALTNPVNDCGCFGDVIKISNWATFAKNLVIMPISLVVFLGRNKGRSISPGWYAFAIPLSFATAVYCFFNLPLIDATPYKIGVNIPEAMIVPVTAQQAESHTVLVYKNIENGTLREFEIEDTEWQDDSVWEYVDTKTTIINEGYVPPIKSLPMIDSDGRDVALDVLSRKGTMLLVVTNDYETLEIERVKNSAVRKNIDNIVFLTSSSIDISGVSQSEVFLSDHTVINTIIQNRAGGALLLKNGVISAKYVMRELTKD